MTSAASFTSFGDTDKDTITARQSSYAIDSSPTLTEKLVEKGESPTESGRSWFSSAVEKVKSGVSSLFASHKVEERHHTRPVSRPPVPLYRRDYSPGRQWSKSGINLGLPRHEPRAVLAVELAEGPVVELDEDLVAMIRGLSAGESIQVTLVVEKRDSPEAMEEH